MIVGRGGNRVLKAYKEKEMIKFNMNFDIKWIIIIPIIIILCLAVTNIYQCNDSKKSETYNRQLSGNLTLAEKDLQSAHHELGVLKSKLLSEKELSKYWEDNKDATDKEFSGFMKKNNLKIKSLDKTIAQLNQEIKNGLSDIEISSNCNIDKECIISYAWQDKDGRFILKDPDIFEKNNEIFESNQVFIIKGIIAEQKNGSLQVRKLSLQEVHQKEDGTYEPIPDAKADIIESDFKYSNPPSEKTDWKFTDLFRLRAIALGSVTAIPDGGTLRLGLGMEFFDWNGLGINTYTAFNFKDAKKIEQRLGLSYNPNLFNKELNLAIGVSVGTPFYKVFQEYSFNVDLIFYINN